MHETDFITINRVSNGWVVMRDGRGGSIPVILAVFNKMAELNTWLAENFAVKSQ